LCGSSLRRNLLVSNSLSAVAMVMAVVKKDEKTEAYRRVVLSSAGVRRRRMVWIMDWGMASIVISVIRVSKSIISLFNFWFGKGLEPMAFLQPSINGFKPTNQANPTHKGCPIARLTTH